MFLSLSVHQGHLDGLHSAERGARWECFYHLHFELGLAVQLVSLVQTADNGREPSNLALTPAALALYLRAEAQAGCYAVIFLFIGAKNSTANKRRERKLSSILSHL